MVDMDEWCPGCGYSVDPGTRFCGGCGQPLAAESGAPVAQSPAWRSAGPQSSTVTMQAPAPYPVYPSPGGTPLSAPPPPSGSPLPYPPPPMAGPAGPPPGAYPPPPGQPGPDPAVSDTLEQMLRPQGLFHSVPPAPAEWQQPTQLQPPQPPQAQPVPGGYPPGSYPEPAPYPQGGPYPQPAPPAAPGAYPQTGGFPATGGFPQTGGFAQTGNFPQAGPPPAWPGGGPGPNAQFGPGSPYARDGMPAAGPERPGLLTRLQARGPLLPAAVAVLAALVVVVALVLATQHGPSANSAGGAASTPTAPASASAERTQQQAALALSGLLSQSGTDHSDVNAAVTSVAECNGLSADAKTFNKAAANRQALLAKLATLPGRAALPAAMLSELTGAWQASAMVDADLAKWAADGVGHCKKNNYKDPNYAATLPFDSKATNDKTAFVRQWNGLARRYGLPRYSPSQI
jgi:hypothetical protein